MISITDRTPQESQDYPATLHVNGESASNAKSLSDTAAAMLPEKVIRAKLSPTLAGIAELISVSATLRLCQRFGGSRIYVAEKPTRRGAIARAIGFEAACKLAKTYGREELHIPRGSGLRRVIRNEKILRAHRAGKTVREIAFDFDLGTRQISNILADN
jgi:Mor family transcriptional regulator